MYSAILDYVSWLWGRCSTGCYLPDALKALFFISRFSKVSVLEISFFSPNPHSCKVSHGSWDYYLLLGDSNFLSVLCLVDSRNKKFQHSPIQDILISLFPPSLSFSPALVFPYFIFFPVFRQCLPMSHPCSSVHFKRKWHWILWRLSDCLSGRGRGKLCALPIISSSIVAKAWCNIVMAKAEWLRQWILCLTGIF